MNSMQFTVNPQGNVINQCWRVPASRGSRDAVDPRAASQTSDASSGSSLLDQIAAALYAAAAAENWSSVVSARAIAGLAGHVCGNHDIDAALRVLDKLPEKFARKIAHKIEIGIGWFINAVERDGEIIITPCPTRLFSYSRASGWSCTWYTLIHGSRKERNDAYDQICNNRKRLPQDWLARVKIARLGEPDKGIELLTRLNRVIAAIDASQSEWIGSEAEAELRDALEKLGRLTNISSKDTLIAATTAGVGGRPRGRK